MKEVIRYKCGYCKKVYANKSMTKKHESICFYNPENKGCGSCLYLQEDYSCFAKVDNKAVIDCLNYANRDEVIEKLERGDKL